MELKNSARFWTGIAMGLLEVVAITIFGLTLLNWSWITERVVFGGMIILAVVLYNGLAITLILNGSGKE